uniref:Uncharacterized protein n=1 Tax=Acrobeloides nanus TaxID=290746 RepID=A0A914DDY1_9BILA
MGSKVTIVKEWINKKVLKTEIMLEIAKLVEDLIISNNYIQSNETLPNDATAKKLLTNLQYGLNHINDLKKELQSQGVEEFEESTIELLEARISLLDLDDSKYYIDNLILNGIVNDTEYDIHQKVASIEKNINNLKWLEQKTMDPSSEDYFKRNLPQFEMLLELSKLVENFALFNKYANWKMEEAATPLLMDKIAKFLNNMKDQLTTVHGLNKQFQQQGIETIDEDIIIAIEERFNKTAENLSVGDKEKLHETVVQIERDFNALYLNDSIMETTFALVETAKIYEEFTQFYDYFSVDESGEITAEIKPDIMDRMKKIVDSLNEHIKYLKKSGSNYGEVYPLFIELYFEAISLKHDSKRNPARALYLIDEMDKMVEITFGDTDGERLITIGQQQDLHELLKKAKEETLSGQNGFYKSILLALVQFKHHL